MLNSNKFNQKINDSQFVVNFTSENEKIAIPKNIDQLVFVNLNIKNLEIDIFSEVFILFIYKNINANLNIVVNLMNEKANVKIHELVFAKKRNKFLKQIKINHFAPNSLSNYFFVGFAFDESFIQILAKSEIFEKMRAAEAHQHLQIFTKDEATARSEPGLLINFYDVKASHGNAIGQIDDQLVYYLETKGIDPNSGIKMIMNAFIKRILLPLNNKNRGKIEQILNYKKHE